MIRTIDRDIAVGVYRDMSEHGRATDEWPTPYEMVLAADILVLRTTWPGDKATRQPGRAARADHGDVLPDRTDFPCREWYPNGKTVIQVDADGEHTAESTSTSVLSGTPRRR